MPLSKPIALISLLPVHVHVALLASLVEAQRKRHCPLILLPTPLMLRIVQYPTIARKCITFFDCTPFEGDTYLRADPTLSCSSMEWKLGATIATIGIFVYCLGTPLPLLVI